MTRERLYTIVGSSLFHGRVVWQFSCGDIRLLTIRLANAGHKHVRLHALPDPMPATLARAWILGRGRAAAVHTGRRPVVSMPARGGRNVYTLMC